MKSNANAREVIGGGLRDHKTNKPLGTIASRSIARTAVHLAGLAAMLILMSGCVGVLPLPTTSNKPEYGCRIDCGQVAFIHPGRTTRAQVVARLGNDYAALPLNRAIAYTWELPGGGGIWWYCIVAGEAGAAGGGSWAGGWRGFLVAFDNQDVVTATTFKKLSSRRSLHEHMDRWVAKLPPITSPIMARDIADYRAPSFDGSPGLEPDRIK